MNVLRAEIVDMISNECTDDWRNWKPEDPDDFVHWFTVDIGLVGERGTYSFQTAFATVSQIKGTQRAGKEFRGFIVKEWSPEQIEKQLNDYVSGLKGYDWDDFLTILLDKMHWEYEGMYGLTKEKFQSLCKNKVPPEESSEQ